MTDPQSQGRTDELLAIIKKALDDHQQDTWVEEIVGGRRGSFVMTGDCSMTGEDGYEGHDEPFTLHQARWVLAALENAEVPCRCVEVEGYGIDRTACRADVHRDDPENTDVPMSDTYGHDDA